MSTIITQILAPTVDAETSSEFTVHNLPVTLRLSGAGALLRQGESVTLEYKDASETWRAVVDPIAGAAAMDAGDSCMRIIASGAYRAVKTPTADATGLEIIASTLS